MATFRGTGRDDIFNGGSGKDSIDGGNGNDSLSGAGGNDTIDGGSGSDLMTGGAGDDIFIVDAAGDVVLEYPGQGTDTVQTGLWNYALPANVENLIRTDPANTYGAVLTGNELANVITGNAGYAETLNGGGGNDTLSSGGGNDDMLIGGDGNDTFVLEGLWPVLVDGGNGTDTLLLSAGNAPGDYSRVYFYGSQLSIERVAFASGGESLEADLTPRQLANLGTPTLVGGAGIDSLKITLDSPSNYIIEDITYQVPSFTFSNWTTTSFFTTSDRIEVHALGRDHFTLIASDQPGSIQWLDGSSDQDVLIGSAGNEYLTGNGGKDTIKGGGGSDTITGGGGNDVFIITGAGTELISDFVVGQDKIDLTQTGIDSFAEIRSSFSSVADGTILDLGITTVHLWGLSPANLNAASFIFALPGSARVITGSVNPEKIDGGGGNDSLNGAGGNDTITGGAGNDSIDGGSGNDRMAGGRGDDIYIVDSKNDVIVENGGEGTDTIRTTLASFSLTGLPNIENLAYGGVAGATLTGNDSANMLTGGIGNDTLSGGAGNDTLSGGTGNDSLAGGSGADTFRFDTPLNAAGNVDKISSFSAVNDDIELNQTIFHSLAAGSVSSDMVRVGAGATTAADADDFLIYNMTTGALFYDADGSGAIFAPVQFATLIGAPAISFNDFQVA